MQKSSFGKKATRPRSGLARLATLCSSAVNVIARRFGWTADPSPRFDREALLLRQRELFLNLGLSRDEGHQALRECYGDGYSLRRESEHPLLIAAVSRRVTYKRILEIGTYDGENARLLATLFPDALVTTIDLRDDDPVFLSSYRRDDTQFLEQFLATRAMNLQARSNIRFQQLNSLELLRANEVYDFIWVDGAHGYPIVAIDIANAVRLLSDDGLIGCDDVWVGRSIEDSDALSKSCAPYDTLQSLKAAGLVDFRLIFKRLTFKDAGRRATKHIAIVRRTLQATSGEAGTHIMSDWCGSPSPPALDHRNPE